MEEKLIEFASSVARPLIESCLNKIGKELSDRNKLINLYVISDKYVESNLRLVHVKTLSSHDISQATYINDIYVPLILNGVNSSSLTITSTSTLELNNRAILIKGFAGMGKSTILRKLLINNMFVYGPGIIEDNSCFLFAC